MLDLVLDVLSWTLILGGGAFILIGGIGIVRLPDFYTRLHAAGMIDTLGADLMLVGMAVQAGPTLVAVKLLLIAVFLLFTSPVATHALANAAFTEGLKPLGEGDLENGRPRPGVTHHLDPEQH
ncbi:monovalent cation/H(+) antiporter subunit G [Roseospirillum parvum]|uniref:Multicomponent Na+:H+ antiporter subunit G n=1 Tax=Roseospirillum parvum TaxID=83401 RepID=A0A1G7XLD7_9PROT|nr:monovalent cation/H(+) antiporter subunit G [Roseospirillum parvum]SDG85045.1 multicomponent Na+:H+ antiporter subunit G [Roseospirillum parvum]